VAVAANIQENEIKTAAKIHYEQEFPEIKSFQNKTKAYSGLSTKPDHMKDDRKPPPIEIANTATQYTTQEHYSTSTAITQTKMKRTAWNIIVTPTMTKVPIEIKKVISGILDSMQNADKSIALLPKDTEETETKEITKSTEIPNTEYELEIFIDSPRITNSNKLIFQLYLGSSTEYEYNTGHQLHRTWLAKNQIKMSISKLKTNKPMFEGYYDEPNPEKNKIHFLEKQIKQQLTDKNTDFQVDIVALFIHGKGNSSQVHMVYTSMEEVSNIREQLSKAANNMHTFYRWDQYGDLSAHQKLHLIEKQHHNNYEFRSRMI
jgi:hypothetical protein